MANYSLVINSKFQPFSFERYIQPYQIYGQAYREQTDALSELATKANIWDRMTEPGSKAHSMYESYAKDLESQAEQLSKYGLTPTSRQQMLNMRNRYSSDIIPIEQAYKRREEQIAEQRKAGNSMIYDYDARTTSLDKYIDDPALSYRAIDRKELYNRAVNDFSQYAKALSDYGNGKRLDAFTKTFIQDYGITPDQAREFIFAMRTGNISTANPTLRAVYDALYNSTGVSRWDNADAEDTVKETIFEGVGAAIGKSAVSHYDDRGAIMAQQMANQRALLGAGNGDPSGLKAFDPNPSFFYSKTDITKANEKLAEDLKKWKDKGYYDDKGNITEKGIKTLNFTYSKNAAYARHDKDGITGDPEFKRWAKSDAVRRSKYSTVTPGQGRRYDYLSNYYKRVSDAIANGELATGAANFEVFRGAAIKGDDRELALEKIINSLGKDSSIERAEGLDANNNIIGKPVPVKDFINAVREKMTGSETNGSKINNILYIGNSPVTGENGQQFVELVDGSKYLLPSGVLGTDTQANLDRSNQSIRNADSREEVATNVNLVNNYLSSILTNTGGTEIKPNDGTIIIERRQYGKESFNPNRYLQE